MTNGNLTISPRSSTVMGNGAAALLMRRAEPSAIEHLPVILKSDARLLKADAAYVMNYSVLEVKQGGSTRLIVRFGNFRKAQEEITSGAIAELKSIDPSLEARPVESGTISMLGSVLSSTENSGRGLGLKMVNSLFSDGLRV